MSKLLVMRRAKKGQRRKMMDAPSPEGWAAAEARRADVKAALMRFPVLHQDIDDHVQHVLRYVARSWDLYRPEMGSSWAVYGLQPVYFQAGRLMASVLNRGMRLSKKERQRRAEQGDCIRFTSTDYVLPGGEIVNILPAPPPPDRTIADAAALLRRWLAARTPRSAAEAAALEVMTRRAHGDDEISLAEAGRRRGGLSRERVRQVQLQLYADFRDAHPELKELLKEAA